MQESVCNSSDFQGYLYSSKPWSGSVHISFRLCLQVNDVKNWAPGTGVVNFTRLIKQPEILIATYLTKQEGKFTKQESRRGQLWKRLLKLSFTSSGGERLKAGQSMKDG